MRLTPVRAALAAATAVLVGVPTVATSAGPASAEPIGGQPAAGSVADRARVTLVTGDVAELTTLPNGVQEARLTGGAEANDGAHAFTQSGDAYLVPASARGMLAQDKLDLELFNVSELVKAGYDDGVPVIVDYQAPRTGDRAALVAPDGTEGSESLPSISAVAAQTVAEEGDAFWADVSTEGSRPIEKVWYDAPIEASLDESAAQIGAPAAWERGLTGKGVTIATLDSGIDVSHPDFEGRIVATEDFSGSDSVSDGYGHGTHVASIAAGSGAASDGKYRGIASDADLLVGKVLRDDGTGSTSMAIEGMEWAVAHGADIVNMSLGGPITNGDDPMSQAADELTAERGTLFVAAAGNHSYETPGMHFVSSPASAESALAVGATNRDPDSLWDGSNRARMDGDAIKPGDLRARRQHHRCGFIGRGLPGVHQWYRYLDGGSPRRRRRRPAEAAAPRLGCRGAARRTDVHGGTDRRPLERLRTGRRSGRPRPGHPPGRVRRHGDASARLLRPPVPRPHDHSHAHLPQRVGRAGRSRPRHRAAGEAARHGTDGRADRSAGDPAPASR